jgi:glycosyl transferase family 25
MKIPVLVISSPGSRRHALAKAHLDDLGLEHALIESVFLGTSAELCPGYDHRRRLRELGYPLTKGEVGCFLAHKSAWEAVASGNVPAVVMEDDARLTSESAAQLETIGKAVRSTTHLVRFFSVRHPRHKTWKRLSDSLALVRPFSPGGSTVAYLLTPECARKLLEGSRGFWLAVDEFMDDEASHGCAVLHSVPELVTHEDEGSSLVGARVKPPLSLRRKFVREWRRALRNLGKLIHRERTLWRLGLRF